MPPYYEDIGNDLLLESDIYSPEGVYDNQGVPYSPLLDSLIENIFHPEIGQNRHPFMDFVRMIESGEEVLMLPGETMGMTAYPEGNPEALAKNLYGEGQPAAGAYQFTEDTVDAAKNRAKQLGMTNEFLKTVSDDPTKWTSNQADVMFLANLFTRTVDKGENTFYKREGKPKLVDELLNKAFVDLDRNAMEDIYYTLHHITRMKEYPETRGVPPETIDRVNRIRVPK